MIYTEAQRKTCATCEKRITARIPGGHFRLWCGTPLRQRCPAAGRYTRHIADEGAVTAGAAHRLRCHVGAVGLQHDAFQRQGADGFCRPLGTLEGTRPAKTDEQSLLCQPHRVIGTAGIAVDDALGLVFFQQGVNVGVGVRSCTMMGLSSSSASRMCASNMASWASLGTGQW